MRDLTDSDRDECEALDALLASPGWAIFRAAVLHEWAERKDRGITQALAEPADPLALATLRQIEAATRAVALVLHWPSDRLGQLHGGSPRVGPERRPSLPAALSAYSRRGSL